MAFASSGALAAALLLHNPAAPIAPRAQDALLDGLLESPDAVPRALHDRLRAEAVDPGWAPATEALLRARYARIPGIATDPPLRILCGATLCEVTGLLAGRIDAEVNATMQILQGAPLVQELAAQKLTVQTNGFYGGKNEKTRFVTYWQRAGH